MQVIRKLFGEMKESSEEEKKAGDDGIEESMITERKKKAQMIEFLLLGCGNSGKTTIYHQIERIYAKKCRSHDSASKSGTDDSESTGLDELWFSSYGSTIPQEIKERMSTISKLCLEQSSSWSAELTPTDTVLKLCESFASALFRLCDHSAKDIQLWWDSPSIKYAITLPKDSTGLDNLGYFINNIERIMQEDYQATYEDMIRYCNRTTGVQTKSIRIPFGMKSDDYWLLEITDNGGQRCERKKWGTIIRSDYHSIIYVMSLSEFDKVLFEDYTQLCYDETLDLFSKMTKREEFAKINFNVFLNKWDQFQDKLKTIPFSYNDDESSDDGDSSKYAHLNADLAAKYVSELFQKRFEKGNEYLRESGKDPNRSIYFHLTCAIDEDHLSKIIEMIVTESIKIAMKEESF